MAILKWPTFWAPTPAKPTAPYIRCLTTPDVIKAGRQCYRQGGVVSAFIHRNLVWASVADADQTYRVVAPLGNLITPYCTCRQGERQACTHGVATLMHVSSRFSKLMQDDPWKRASDAVADLSEEALREFVTAALADGLLPSVQERPRPTRRAVMKQPMTRSRPYGQTGPSVSRAQSREFVVSLLNKSVEAKRLFETRFGEPDLPDHQDCHLEMTYMVYETSQMVDQGKIRFTDFFRAAKAHERRGNFTEAVLIYRNISEAIVVDGAELEHADNHYDLTARKALDRMVLCIKRRLTDPKQRQYHIKYLHGILADAYTGSLYGKMYYDALLKVCNNRKDLEYLNEINGSVLDGETALHDDCRNLMLDMRVEILGRLAGPGGHRV